jgi:hypothetical protein
MSKTKKLKKEIKSKLEVIKKINDDPKKVSDDLYDAYLKDLPSTDQLFGKKFGDFLDKRKKKKENNKDIFSEIIDIAEGFLSKNNPRGGTDRLFSKNRLKKHGLDSTTVSLRSSKDIVLNRAKEIFFSSDGICGADSTIKTDTITLRPKEFDFLNLLTIDPNCDIGKISYEPISQVSGKEKVNRKLYETFGGTPYQFDSQNNNTLFTLNWDAPNQQFNVAGLTRGTPAVIKVEDFFNDYYSTIELPDIQQIVKNAMFLSLGGGGNCVSVDFQKGVDFLNRLLAKLFAICGSPKDGQNLKQNAVNMFNENDEDVEFYFNFDDIEGIDLDDENNRFRRVLKFADCNNFELPVDDTILEDFIYLSNNKPLNDLITNTLNDAANTAFDRSNGTIPQINFNINLINNFILSLPKALIMTLLTPKIFLPIIIIYKLFKASIGAVLEVKDVMKKLSKLFSAIIKDLFWLFIREFWRLLKIDLLNFIQVIAAKILKNKFKRYLTIIRSIISILQQILIRPPDNCFDIFNLILTTINGALRGGIANSIPAILLSFSNRLPGYSQDRAFMNISERLEAAGIPMGPIYGAANDLPALVKSIIDGHTEEEDKNGFIAGGNTFFTLPVPPLGAGPMVFPPGIIRTFGKKR